MIYDLDKVSHPPFLPSIAFLGHRIIGKIQCFRRKLFSFLQERMGALKKFFFGHSVLYVLRILLVEFVQELAYNL